MTSEVLGFEISDPKNPYNFIVPAGFIALMLVSQFRNYRAEKKSLQIMLSSTLAEPG